LLKSHTGSPILHSRFLFSAIIRAGGNYYDRRFAERKRADLRLRDRGTGAPRNPGNREFEGDGRTAERIGSYKDLRVYQNAMDAAMKIFELTKAFPSEEKYSMVDQVRRSSRSVCSNIAEAWRKRRYKAAFIAKLSDLPC
jgi:hypothetical protein